MLSTDNDNHEDARVEAETADGQGASNVAAAKTACPFAPPPERFNPPRLGIIHLLAWTGIAAIYLKYCAAMGVFDFVADSTNTVQWIVTIIHGLINTLVVAAVIEGGCVILLAKMRGSKGTLQPGHWMLVISSILTIASIGCWTLGVFIKDWLEVTADIEYPGADLYIYKMHYICLDILAIPLCLIAAVRLKDAFRWRLMFWASIITSVVGCMMNTAVVGLMFIDFTTIGYHAWMVSEYPIGSILMLIFFSAAVLIDFLSRVKRDWLHWLGVVSSIVLHVWGMIYFFLRMFVVTSIEA